jgi:hypothetical protein
MLTSINKFAKEVEKMIFHRLYEEKVGEMEEQDSEMEENEFQDMLHDIRHEVLDHEVSIMYIGILDELLCEYGVQKAYKSYLDEYGINCEMPTSRCVLYHIINDRISISLSDYQEWCSENEESDDDE